MNAQELEKMLAEVTPGDWRLEQNTTLIWGACNPDDSTSYGMGYPVAETRITPAGLWARGPNVDDGVANARLIALAPKLARRVIAAEKMADALKEVSCRSTLLTDGGELDWLIDEAKEALAEWESSQ